MIKSIRSLKLVRNISHRSGLDIAESRIRNDRQSVFTLTRELVNAQFELGDQELTNRLWQDVADRNIDIGRIINLMYGCFSYDDETMLEADLSYEKGKA